MVYINKSVYNLIYSGMKYIKTFENHTDYDKFQPLNPHNEKIYDLIKIPELDSIFYSDSPTKEAIKYLKKILNDKESYVLMYHGTSSEYDIESEGLKRTKLGTKKSIQSETGFVYLSVYPDMAKQFGQMAYPREQVNVYQVFVKIKYLKPDKDQLRNKRLYSDISVSDTLYNSIVYGRGARVKRDILPYEIKKFKI